MKIPEIKGINKIRDAIICQLYVEGYSTVEIKDIRRLPISIRQIDRILYKNRDVIKIDKDWEELKQIHRIRRRIGKATVSRKDVYDWEVLLNNKITPKKTDSSPTREQLIIINNISANNPSRIPEEISL